jgi:cyclohexanecarboxylate-CoA ligase
MTATGKVLKHELRKDIERRLDEEAAAATEVAGAT